MLVTYSHQRKVIYAGVLTKFLFKLPVKFLYLAFMVVKFFSIPCPLLSSLLQFSKSDVFLGGILKGFKIWIIK